MSAEIQSLEAATLLASLPPMSLDSFMEQSGLSPTTCWRYRKRGWLETIVIAGRRYVTRAAIAEFNRRAAAGEFSGPALVCNLPPRHKRPAAR